jgi:hypothetical protein
MVGATGICMSEPLIDKREHKKSDKLFQEWISGRYEDCAVVLKIGENYFGGFSGMTAADGRSLAKIRNGLAEAKVIWGLRVSDWVPPQNLIREGLFLHQG